jgi:hypothetical protein
VRTGASVQQVDDLEHIEDEDCARLGARGVIDLVKVPQVKPDQFRVMLLRAI